MALDFRMFFFPLIFGMCGLWYDGSDADVFTSMSDMHTLLHTEEEVIRTMENYIATQEARLHRLRK